MFNQISRLYCKRSTPVPGSAPAAHPPLSVPHAGNALLRVAELKQQAGAATYLETVPDRYRSIVAGLAEKAFPTKGGNRTINEFTDLMAKEWLAKKELFESIARDNGFEPVSTVPVNERRPILALTVNGSIIGLYEQSGAEPRTISYDRIAIRAETKTRTKSTGTLDRPPRIDDRLYLSRFSSSPLIMLAVKAPGAGNHDHALERSLLQLDNAHTVLTRSIYQK